MNGFITLTLYTVCTGIFQKLGFMLYFCYNLLQKLYAKSLFVVSISLTSWFALSFSVRHLETAVGTWKGDGERILSSKKGTKVFLSVGVFLFGFVWFCLGFFLNKILTSVVLEIVFLVIISTLGVDVCFFFHVLTFFFSSFFLL